MDCHKLAFVVMKYPDEIKMIKKILIAIFIIVAVIGIFEELNNLLDNDCVALYAFDGFGIREFIKGIMLLLLMIFVLLIGSAAYVFISRKIKINIILYFVILSLITSSYFIRGIYFKLKDQNKGIKARICEKSVDNGMTCKMKGLTIEEYHFLPNKSLLPKIPDFSEKINIDFYRDDFLGDYILTIRILVPKEKMLDTIQNPGWTKVFEQDGAYIVYEYCDEQS
jgi:hypothetical protein